MSDRRYAEQHHGVAIVCGGGPSLFSDLAAAQVQRPDHTLLGANFVASVVPGIQHVWTQHIEIAGKIKAQCPGVKVHSRPRKFQASSGGGNWFLGVSKEQENQVDYLWPSLGWVGGSSGFSAALWAKYGMGFDEVILAGVGLAPESRRYDAEYDTVTRMAERGPQHDNGQHFASEGSLMHWWDCIHRFKDAGKTTGIYSMSGETKKILGGPP